MKKNKKIFWSIVIWICAFLFFIIPLYIYNSADIVFHSAISFFTYLAVFYLNILWILPKWIRRRNLGILLLIWAGLIIISTIVSLFLNHLLGVFTRNGNIGLEIINTFLKNLVLVSIVLFLGATYIYIIDRFKNEKMLHTLENQNLKAELDFLRSQVNPHFLFNTLNNIYSLAYENSDKTAGSIMMLSEIMRYMLYDSNAERVPLSREIHYLTLLTSLHKLRINGPMMLDFSVDGDPDNYYIAPLILISFVENILKHGVLNDKNNPAVVKISLNKNCLIFFSSNKIHYGLKDVNGGIGLVNVKRRIELLYPGQHDLKTEEKDQFFTVNLKLNSEHDG